MAYETLTAIPSGDLLADAAYAQLSEAILRNDLPPGTSLSVPELSRRLGISRSPVREAVQRLIYDGLADYRGRRGTVVSSIEVADFVSLLEVREVLEGLAARMAAARASHEEILELRSLHRQFLALDPPHEHDGPEFVELDMAFHQCIRDMARNDELATHLARAQARAHLSMHSLWSGTRNVVAVQHEHGAVLDAIAARDLDGAASAARAHIAALRERTLAMSSETSDARSSPVLHVT